jgi:hypothetical protein
VIRAILTGQGTHLHAVIWSYGVCLLDTLELLLEFGTTVQNKEMDRENAVACITIKLLAWAALVYILQMLFDAKCSRRVRR